jgi:hypothetical protein
MTSQKCGAFFYDVALLWISSDVASLYVSKKPGGNNIGNQHPLHLPR